MNPLPTSAAAAPAAGRYPIARGPVNPGQRWAYRPPVGSTRAARMGDRDVLVLDVVFNAEPVGRRALLENVATLRRSWSRVRRSGRSIVGYKLADDPNRYRAAVLTLPGYQRLGDPTDWCDRYDEAAALTDALLAAALDAFPLARAVAVVERRPPDDAGP